MVAIKKTAVYQEFGHAMKSSILDVDEDCDSSVDRLREVLNARDVSMWNFDFRTSTPLPGRYDWCRRSDHGVVAVQEGRPAADRDPFVVHRGRLPSTLRRGSARRRLVFDEHDLLAADRAVTTFLLRRLIPPQRNRENPEQCSPESQEVQPSEMHSTTSTPSAVVCFDNGQRNQKTVSTDDVENSCVQSSSSTDRQMLPVAMRQTTSTHHSSSLRASKITGKPTYC